MKSASVMSMALVVDGKPQHGRHKAQGNVFTTMLKADATHGKASHKPLDGAAASHQAPLEALVARLSKAFSAEEEKDATGRLEGKEPRKSRTENEPDESAETAVATVSGLAPIPDTQTKTPGEPRSERNIETGPQSSGVDAQQTLRTPSISGKADLRSDRPQPDQTEELVQAEPPTDAADTDERSKTAPAKPVIDRAAREPATPPTQPIVSDPRDVPVIAENDSRPVTVLRDSRPTKPVIAAAANAVEPNDTLKPIAQLQIEPGASDDGAAVSADTRRETSIKNDAAPQIIDADVSVPKPAEGEPVKVAPAAERPSIQTQVAQAAQVSVFEDQKPAQARSNESPAKRANSGEPAFKTSNVVPDATTPETKAPQAEPIEIRERAQDISTDADAATSEDKASATAEVRTSMKADAPAAIAPQPQPAAKLATPAATVSAAIATAQSAQALDVKTDVHTTATGSAQVLKIQLHPGEMGVVTATLRMTGDQISVELAADKHEAYEQLTSDTDTIVKSLRSLGLQIDQITVTPPQVASTGAAKSEAGSMQNAPQRDQQFGQAGGSSSGGQSNGQGNNGANRGTSDDGARFAGSGKGSREQPDRGLVI